MTTGKQLLNYILQHYLVAEFPALYAQILEWEKSKPLQGLRILDATPIFRNTIAKYAALVSAGAKLYISKTPTIPYDANIVKLLKDFDINLADDSQKDKGFDIVLDCAATNINVKSKFGYVELTKTGAHIYKKSNKTVFLADESIIKSIETALGTGDGFVRAIESLNLCDNIQNKKFVVFGCGKVGSGIVLCLLKKNCKVYAVDDTSRVKIPDGAIAVDMNCPNDINFALKDAWCAVSASGIKNAHSGKFDLKELAESKTIIVNMGVEDEFGKDIPDDRVLAKKQPLNFILQEPTRLRYIDPTLALHNFGAIPLINGKLNAGLNLVQKSDEDRILKCVKDNGLIKDELENFLKLRK